MFKTPSKPKGLSPTGEKGKWSFLMNSPHSPGGKLPFIGGAKQKFNSGVNYKVMVNSTPSVKSFRVLDRMPKNLLEETSQSYLKNYMNDTFCMPN